MNNSLDDLLNDWSARQDPGSVKLNKLAGRIVQEAGRRTGVVEDESIFVVPFFQKLQYAGLGAAVAMAVCVLCLSVMNPDVRNPNWVKEPAFAVVSAQELFAGKKLFSEMDRLFEGKLKWVAQSNGDVGVGVETAAGMADISGLPVLVRLTVLSRKVGDKEWGKAWNADVVMRGEELVEIVPNDKSGNKLALWVYQLEDGKLAVDTNIALVQPAQIASRSNMVVARGQAADIAQLRAGNQEYRVLQSVEIL